MALSLFLTTLFSLVFLPIGFILYKSESKSKLSYIVYGGATWSIISVFQLILLQLINLITDFSLANESSFASFVQVQTEQRTILFWYLFATAIIGNIILFIGSEKVLDGETLIDYILFGLGWGVSEFLQRFLFFDNDDFMLQFYLILYSILIAMSIGAVLIRTNENSKFIMFASLIKFFSEIGIFGSIGYNFTSGTMIDLYLILFFSLSLSVLSMITRRFPLKD